MPKRVHIHHSSQKTPDGRSTVSFKGVGFIPKSRFKQGLKGPRARSEFSAEGLTDEQLNACLKAGWRVNDKRRGIYVHG